MAGDEFGKTTSAEFLVIGIERFRDSVGVKQQAEIVAERDLVFGELAGKQAERHASVGVQRTNVAAVAEQGPGMSGAGEGELAARGIEDGVDHGDVAAGC